MSDAIRPLGKTYLERLGHLIPSDRSFPILCGPLRGCRWLTGAAAGWAKGASIYFHNAENRQLASVARQTSSEDVAFDLGANVGLYTLLFAKRGAQVVAFELRGADAVLRRKPKWFISFHSKELREQSIQLMEKYDYQAAPVSGREGDSEVFFQCSVGRIP